MPTKANKRTARIVTYVEPEVYEAIVAFAEAHDRNMSDMLRSLVLGELRRQGLMPSTTLDRLVGIA